MRNQSYTYYNLHLIIIGDNKRISEALKEISSLEYVSWDTACRLRALSKQK